MTKIPKEIRNLIVEIYDEHKNHLPYYNERLDDLIEEVVLNNDFIISLKEGIEHNEKYLRSKLFKPKRLINKTEQKRKLLALLEERNE